MIKFYYADPAEHGFGHKVRTEALADCFEQQAEVWPGRAQRGEIIFLDCPGVNFRHAKTIISVSDCKLPHVDLELKPWELVRDEFFDNGRRTSIDFSHDSVGVFIGSGEANKKWFAEYVMDIKAMFETVEFIWSEDNLSAGKLDQAMRRHAINIVTAGMMAYESLATGTPTVVVDPARVWDIPDVPTVLDPTGLAYVYWLCERSVVSSYEGISVSTTAEKLTWFLKGVESCGPQ